MSSLWQVPHLWWYRSRVIPGHDGDTVLAELDLFEGIRIEVLHPLRLDGIDTEELNSPDPARRNRAEQAREFTTRWLQTHLHGIAADDWPFYVHTTKTARAVPHLEKYGRLLASVWCTQGHNLSDDLLAAGLAKLPA